MAHPENYGTEARTFGCPQKMTTGDGRAPEQHKRQRLKSAATILFGRKSSMLSIAFNHAAGQC